MPSKMLQPALVGGLFIGVLSALPIINFANCCCLWVIGGGIVTAYLLQNATPVAITIGDGALGGLMAGIFGAVIDTILSIPIRLIMGPLQMHMFQRWAENAPQDMPEPLRRFMEPGFMAGGIALGVIFTFVVMLCIGAIFATIGGMIGAAIFKSGKPTVLSAPPQPPPPPPSM